MKKKRNLMLGLLLLFVMLAGSSVQAEEVQGSGPEELKIGVVVYDPDSSEMEMFMNYYRDYLEEGFAVKFYFSGKVSSAEEENAFIESAKAAGAQGIISFYGGDLQSTLQICEENELYYIMGSGNITDETFASVKENPWFVGIIGPNPDSVYQTGRDMAEFFLEKGGKSFIIMTGAANVGYRNHVLRTQGMLDVLEEKAGLVLEKPSEELAGVKENTKLTNEDGSISVILCPEATEGGNGLENLAEAFAEGNCDTLMSAFHAATYLDKIAAQEEAQGSNIMVGAIDSFTEDNFQAFMEKDGFGNPPIDYVNGKFASMAGPSFAMLYNAITGYPEANSADGTAIRLYQELWTATSREEYIELYGYTTGIYENAYSCEDLMQVIKVFNEDTTAEAMKELTESCTVEDVKARILSK